MRRELQAGQVRTADHGVLSGLQIENCRARVTAAGVAREIGRRAVGPGADAHGAVGIAEGESRGRLPVGSGGRRGRIDRRTRAGRLCHRESHFQAGNGHSTRTHRPHDQRLRGGLPGQPYLTVSRHDGKRTGRRGLDRERGRRSGHRGAYLIRPRDVAERKRDRRAPVGARRRAVGAQARVRAGRRRQGPGHGRPAHRIPVLVLDQDGQGRRKDDSDGPHLGVSAHDAQRQGRPGARVAGIAIATANERRRHQEGQGTCAQSRHGVFTPYICLAPGRYRGPDARIRGLIPGNIGAAARPPRCCAGMLLTVPARTRESSGGSRRSPSPRWPGRGSDRIGEEGRRHVAHDHRSSLFARSRFRLPDDSRAAPGVTSGRLSPGREGGRSPTGR